MPCRASPPPPPPPHSSLDLTPSPAPLSNPLVYRLRTCCLQEFLPRVSIKQKRSFASSLSSSARPARTSCSCPCSSQSLTSSSSATTTSTSTTTTTTTTTVSSSSSTGPTLSSSSSSSVPPAKSLSTGTRATENNHTTRPCASFSPRPSPTQLSLLVQNNNQQHTLHCNHINNLVHTPASNINNHSTGLYTHITSSSTIPWLPPMSNIQLSQLQSTLIHRFLSRSLTENNRVSDKSIQQIDACSTFSSSIESADERFFDEDRIDNEPRGGHSRAATTTATTSNGTRTFLLDPATAIDIEKEEADWVETHELVWPEGDYYMAKKTFIREGVAHLRRGRRYIFVEPVLGPAASYLYPRWASPSTSTSTTASSETTAAAAVADAPQSSSTSATSSATTAIHAAVDGAEDSLPTATLSTDSISSLSPPDHGAADGDENNTISNGYLVTPHGGGGVGHPGREDDEDVPNNTNEQDKDQNDEGDSRCQDENPVPGGGGRKGGAAATEGGGLEKVQEGEQGHNSEGDRVLSQDDELVTEDRAPAGQPLHHQQQPQDNTDAASPIGGERSEKAGTDETMAAAAAAAAATPESTNPASVTSATSTAPVSTNAPTTENVSSTDPLSPTSTLDNTLFDSSVQDGGLEDSYSHQDEPSLEPYSPLLDPTMDGQDQFEYGLYELQFIPKIQYLHPNQFLPTRQSFIVHLDEDRPTLASPVPTQRPSSFTSSSSSSSSCSLSPLSSTSSPSRPLTRTECRCQLMMRKALMQQDLLQVWPPVAPIRTLQERQQEAEEEARMMEIKQKVQLQTMHWRKALMTQTVVCG